MVIQMPEKTQLDLAEKIAITLTREEWAVVLMGLSYLPRNNASITTIAERLSDLVQHAAAPVGVLTRCIIKHRAAP